jgi:dTDP-4-dehydrorhamnose 3,5-epimerase
MEFEPLAINGAFLIRPNVAADSRGRFVKPFAVSLFKSNNLRTDFVEQYYSFSKPGVIRGMHFQSPPHQHVKLVYCAFGMIKDVLLDLRKGLSYGQFLSLTLSSDTGEALYIPEGVAHGFATVSNSALVLYNVTSEYQPEHDYGVRWDSFGFDWGINNPILSTRDRDFPRLDEFSTRF